MTSCIRPVHSTLMKSFFKSNADSTGYMFLVPALLRINGLFLTHLSVNSLLVKPHSRNLNLAFNSK